MLYVKTNINKRKKKTKKQKQKKKKKIGKKENEICCREKVPQNKKLFCFGKSDPPKKFLLLNL